MAMSSKAALTTPVDPAKDQVAATRRVLQQMNDAANRAIDAQAAASTADDADDAEEVAGNVRFRGYREL
ncbi:MAG: hypothetical protein WA704_01950 [Pseudolabrys sp.]